MTTESGPDRPVPLDAAARRRRSWGTGAGILFVVGVVVAAMAIAGNTGPAQPAPRPVTTEAAVAAAPSGSATASRPTASSPASASPTSPSAAGSAAASAPAATSPAATSPAAVASASAAVMDVDGDGRPDRASTRFATRRSAQVVVHLASGKTLTSKAFPLYRQGGAGKVFAADVNGDRRAELLVSDPGADGIGYDLFSYVGSALVAVRIPRGNGLYIGGGMYYNSSFGCTGNHLLQVNERPAVKSTGTLPADPPFLVTTTTYALAGATLDVVSSTTVPVADRAAAAAALASRGNNCGTRP